MKNKILLIVFLFSFFNSWSKANVIDNIPDSVYLRVYSTIEDSGQSGMRLSWSTNMEDWHDVADGYGFLKSDFGPWGNGKTMFSPFLIRENNGWTCYWKIKADDDVYAKAFSPNLCDWKRQTYFAGLKIEKHEFNKVSYNEILIAQRYAESQAYRNNLYAETTAEDGARFDGLTTVSAKLTLGSDQKEISDKLFGIFFEDINYAADGGLYAEMIRNRDFEFTESDHKRWQSDSYWALKGSGMSFSIDNKDYLHTNNSHYAILQVSKIGAWLENEGFDGITVKAGELYDFSIFAQVDRGAKLQIQLVDEHENIIANSVLKLNGNKWKKYQCVLTPNASCAKGSIRIMPLTVNQYKLDMISLFPRRTFKGHGLREDLAKVLEDLHPKFVRFPGGCVAHGNGLDNIYDWKGSIGPIEARKPLPNIWNYHQTRGLGYHEYFQFCEDINAEPLPVVAAGVPCQNSSRPHEHSHDLLSTWGQQQGIPMEEMDQYVQDILDLIEYANGDAKKTIWGRKRAENGHPRPFNLKYIGIGNEDLITDVFEERFRLIYDAVRKTYPEITIIGTVGPFYQGSDYDEGWDLARKLEIPMVDEHYYNPPGWFIHNQDFYDKYQRGGTKIYLGEYAAHLPNRANNIETALAEALYLTSVERNGDLVSMTSYAPLLAKENRTNWNPDLIYFTNTEVKPTVNYYVQQLYSTYTGNTYQSNTLSIDNNRRDVKDRIGCSVIKNNAGETIIKVVNMLPVQLDIDLTEIPINAQKIKCITLTGNPDDKLAKPSEVLIDKTNIENLKVGPYSFVILVY